MDKRYKPMTPAEQLAARLSLYDELAATPGVPLKDAIKLIRRKLRLTVPDLAKLTGVSERFLRDTEAGRGNPSLSTAAKVLAPFGLTLGVVAALRKNNER
jgi:XRE family transcriptional regulator, regulator of sulfur utilization